MLHVWITTMSLDGASVAPGRRMTRAAWFLAFALVGCGNKKEAPPAPSPSSESAPATASAGAGDEARTTFNTICATCHGQSGQGDGPGAATLNPKPRNYTDKQWQASVTDDQIAKTILLGGAAVGKSPIMPAQPQLRDKPEVVAELVRIVRGFGK